ncbi:MAG: hypothetical protein ACRD6I_16750 [Candidatus Acidiferrales bacterium]
MTADLVIRRTNEDQNNQINATIKFCWSACAVDSDKIGFLTKLAYENYHAAGRIITLRRNDDLVGLCLWSANQWRELRIIQCWVREDARLILHGRALVDWLELHEAIPRRSWIMRCWVAEDLAANMFWRAIGFDYAGWRWGRAKKPSATAQPRPH